MTAAMALWLLTICPLLPTRAYPEGASESACDTMTPFHRFAAQSTPGPFAINVSSDTYGPNEKLTVTLYAPCGRAQFKGFLIQARRLDQGPITRVGIFDQPSGSQFLQRCGVVGQAATHVINSLKTTMVFEWTAPPQPSGHVVMTVTFVQDIETFWVKLRSAVIKDRTSDVPVLAEDENYPSPVLDCSATPRPSVRDDPCGKDTKCFALCDSSFCDMSVTWSKVPDSDEVLFNMSAVVGRGDNHWMGIAFSDDRAQANDSVVECVSFAGNFSAYLSYNTGTPGVNLRLDAHHKWVTLVSGSLRDGVFTCSFRRRVKVENHTMIYDLDKDWYLIFSRGHTANETDSREHEEGEPIISQKRFYFFGEPPLTTVFVPSVLRPTTPKSSAPVYNSYSALTSAPVLFMVLICYGQ